MSSRLQYRALPVLFAGLFFALHVGDLHRIAPWRDEGATLLFASLSPSELWRATEAVDLTARAYYLFMLPLGHLPDPLGWLRLSSLVAGSILVGAVVHLAQGLRAGARPAMVSGAVAGSFMLVNPLVAEYSLQARSYALVTASIMVATVLLAKSTAPIRSGRAALVGYAVLMAIALGCNVLVAPVLLAHVAYVLVRKVRATPLWWVWGGLLVECLGLVWLGRSQRGQLGWLAKPDPAGVLRNIADAAGFTEAHRDPVLLGVAIAVLALVVIVHAVASSFPRRRDCRAEVALGCLGFVIGPIALGVATFVVSPVWMVRYHLYSIAFFAVLVGWLPAVLVNEPARRVGRPQLASLLLVTIIIVSRLYPPTILDDNADGFPSLARDLPKWVSDNSVESLVVRQAYSESGYLAALAMGFDDRTMFERARSSVLSGPEGWSTFRVFSAKPWRTASSDRPHGRTIVLSTRFSSTAAPPRCTLVKRLGWRRNTSITLWNCP